MKETRAKSVTEKHHKKCTVTMQWCHGILPSESLRTLSHNSTEVWPGCAWAETREGCHFSDKALIMQW